MTTSFHDVEAVTLELNEEGEVIDTYINGVFASAIQVQQEWYTLNTDGIFAIIPRDPSNLPLFLQNCWKGECLLKYLPPDYHTMEVYKTVKDDKEVAKRPMLSERDCSDKYCCDCFLATSHTSYQYPCSKCEGWVLGSRKQYFWEKSCDNCIHTTIANLERNCKFCNDWPNWELDTTMIDYHLHWLNKEYINDME